MFLLVLSEVSNTIWTFCSTAGRGHQAEAPWWLCSRKRSDYPSDHLWPGIRSSSVLGGFSLWIWTPFKPFDWFCTWVIKVMVSKGMIRERPRSAEEAREFIKGEGFSLLVSCDLRISHDWNEMPSLEEGNVMLLLHFVDRLFGWSSICSELCSCEQPEHWGYKRRMGYTWGNEVSISSQNWNVKLCKSLWHFVLSCRSSFSTYQTISLTEWWASTPLNCASLQSMNKLHELEKNLFICIFVQVNQGDMTYVAGGLKLTHPSALPFIKELVKNCLKRERTALLNFQICNILIDCPGRYGG